jgi:hypothetical protein
MSPSAARRSASDANSPRICDDSHLDAVANASCTTSQDATFVRRPSRILGALLCLSRDSDEAAAHGALDALDRDYADLLTVTPLEEMNEMVSLLLEEVAMATERR